MSRIDAKEVVQKNRSRTVNFQRVMVLHNIKGLHTKQFELKK